MNQRTKQRLDILLVEDNPGDVRLAREALRDSEFRPNLHVANDGEEAITVLRGNKDAPPDLIILDLNLPRKDGREVLADIKADPKLRCIPVVVLTTSKAEQDVQNAYDLHANCFITKAADWETSRRLMKSIESFWLDMVTLPRRTS